MRLTEINGKWHITVNELRELGFEYPPKGTNGIFRMIFGDDDNWYKFHEKKERWDGIWISPFLSDVGKRNVCEHEFYIEFTPNLFEYKQPNI